MARLDRGGNTIMYAVVETGGKQYRVSEGDVISVEKLKGNAGDKIEFEKVMLIGESDDVQIGTPYLDAARVFGSIIESGKGKKVIIFKYKSKKDYRKKQGHRQPYTAVQIETITADGKALEKKAAPVVASEVIEAKAEAPAIEATEVEAKKPAAEKKPAAKRAPKKAAAEVVEEKTEQTEQE